MYPQKTFGAANRNERVGTHRIIIHPCHFAYVIYIVLLSFTCIANETKNCEQLERTVSKKTVRVITHK